MADALIYFMENYDARDIGEFINVGTGTDISIREFIGLIKKIIGFEGKIIFDDSKPDGMLRKCLDTTKLKNFCLIPGGVFCGRWVVTPLENSRQLGQVVSCG